MIRSRLESRPRVPSSDPPLGLHPLALGNERDGLVFVPSTYSPDREWPLVVMLHGAGSLGQRGIRPYLERAENRGIVLLAPDSREQTWDVIRGNWGEDVAFVDQALAKVFASCRIDPTRIAIEGFSDGASYALSLGLNNGDLFSRIVAFSPGFVVPTPGVGEPQIWISHGVDDAILPIEHCSRRIARDLQRKGFEVDYREFAGGHEITSDLIDESLAWLGLSADSASPNDQV